MSEKSPNKFALKAAIEWLNEIRLSEPKSALKLDSKADSKLVGFEIGFKFGIKIGFKIGFEIGFEIETKMKMNK